MYVLESPEDENREPSAEQYTQVRTVTVYKQASDPLGLSIKGGRDLGMPAVILAIKEGGSVANTQLLYVGDEILEVNGLSVEQSQHFEAVDVLRAAAVCSAVTFKVRFFSVAARRLTNEHLLGGDSVDGTAALPMRSPRWVPVVAVPLGLCAVTPWEPSSDHSQ